MNKTSEVKGVTWCKEKSKWVVRAYLFKKPISLGVFDNEEDAINKRIEFKSKHKLRNEEELNLIKYYINELYNVDIAVESRSEPLPILRALYCKIAFNVVTNVTYKEVGDVVNRDHSTMYFVRKKLVPEVENNISYLNDYINYPKVCDTNTFNEIKNVEKLKEENRAYFYKNTELIKELKKYTESSKLTKNELKFRELPKKEQKTYNEWAELKIRMMPSNQKRKEESKYEKIKCHA